MEKEPSAEAWKLRRLLRETKSQQHLQCVVPQKIIQNYASRFEFICLLLLRVILVESVQNSAQTHHIKR